MFISKHFMNKLVWFSCSQTNCDMNMCMCLVIKGFMNVFMNILANINEHVRECIR